MMMKIHSIGTSSKCQMKNEYGSLSLSLSSVWIYICTSIWKEILQIHQRYPNVIEVEIVCVQLNAHVCDGTVLIFWFVSKEK